MIKNIKTKGRLYCSASETAGGRCDITLRTQFLEPKQGGLATLRRMGETTVVACTPGAGQWS